MNRLFWLTFSLFSMTLFSNYTFAADKSLLMEIEIPRMNVAEYHKPYVAIWLEDSNRKATQVALWYDLDMKDNEGKKWLKDIRQWWRRVGRSAQQPYDGLTSATKGPGKHKLSIALDSETFAQLPAGDYQLRVEASREVGGKEVVNLPLTWPVTADEFSLAASGNAELGNINIKLK
ncbi:DUF2271 domain-containing protein [Thalassotalea profundi]|uniref:DUF2271 domain-containing protein n=1 Tax=Thalassotalea profundi TaxID=2036687 RepID=A0ABQ3IHY4_9GAMM|nr:DUF2271 domain-containing protein [Thalassotalea profundi]GHE80709.1 hypothetical protein GCM10011501_05850 [Thalassotalea profundi]